MAKIKVYFGERGTLPLPVPTQTMLKQVISAGIRNYGLGLKSSGQKRVRGKPTMADVKNSISLTLVTPEEITQLNKEYRSKDSPTDVLSFPMDGANLGDIVICLEVAENQAWEYGHSLERELAFLTAHGFLHLIGYDHETPEAEKEMIMAQKEMLAWVGMER